MKLSQELRDLQTAILRQDAALDWHPPPTAGVTRPVPAPTVASGPSTGSGPATGSDPAPIPGPATAPGSATAHGPSPAPGRRPPPASPAPERPVRPGTEPSAAGPAGTRPLHHGPSGPVWPLVGRWAEYDALCGTLEAGATSPVFASLVGDPGIGKSRLAAELAAQAEATGRTVAVGRCSRDEGAPPLRPWRDVLRGLSAELPVLEDDELTGADGASFRTWDRIVGAVLSAVRDRPALVILEDLHWASPSTLRALRLLVESADRGRLMVLVTWRAHPEPDGLLADVAEALARRHALRVELDGLGDTEVGEVVELVVGLRPSVPQAAALRSRTDGNPFFLVEYARLAAEGGDLDRLLREPKPPAAVQDVLRRRLAHLPVDTLGTLRTAAVIGREVDVATLALAETCDEERVLDLLEPARLAGLVRDQGDDRYAFAHALVADTLRAGVPPSRLARTHVRVAQALEHTGRASELARHWLAAGPAYATQARGATLAAASAARGVHAHEEATELLLRALDLLPHDPTATLRDRYDLLDAARRELPVAHAVAVARRDHRGGGGRGPRDRGR